ncbi:MAG: proprotein convertase P-domain-containing protein [Caldilineaceae bacterium]|nr:proprotein convertase P-domain-containing protein [Caldilineaceae bacterium]
MPAGLEGIYRLDLLGADQGGQRSYNPTQPPINQTIDTLAPRVSLTSQTVERGMRTEYVFRASDLYLSDAQVTTPCGAEGQVQKTYRWDGNVQGNKQLTELTVTCRLTETPAIQTGSICDTAGNCASAQMTYLPANYASQRNGPGLSDGERGFAHAPGRMASPVLIGYAPPPAQASQGLLLASNVRQSAPIYASTVGSPVSQEEPAGEAGNRAEIDSGLILHWDFVEGPGNCTVQDRTANGLSGSLTNMDCTGAWRTDTPPGQSQGYSLYFGGGQTGEYLTSAVSELFPSGDAPRTLCAWVKSADGAINDWADHAVNYGSAAAGQAFGAMLYTGNTWYAYNHATDLNTQIPADTEWHHHCVVYEGSTLTYYLDGQSLASTAVSLNTAPNTALLAGIRPDLAANTSFDGLIDDVRLYDRALGGDEVQSLYAPVAQSDAPTDAAYPPNTFRFIDLPDVIPNLETPTEISFVAAPWNALTGLEIEIEGETLFSETFGNGGVSQRQARVAWLPPGEGVYRVTAQATDAVSGTVVISRTLFVDATPPTSVMERDTFTTSTYAWGSNLILDGELTDAAGVISATASLEVNGTRSDLVIHLNPESAPVGYLAGNPVYTSAPWSASWRPSAEGDPLDYTEAVLELTVYDASLTPTTIRHPVVFDLQTPTPGQPAIRINGEPAVANQTYVANGFDLAVAIPPTSDAGGVSLWHGWSPFITATVALLSPPVDPVDGLQIDQRIDLAVADGGQSYYFHVLAADGLGNTSRRVYGPYLLDAPGMPDFVHMPELHGNQFAGPHRAWQNNGCTLLGTDARFTDQSLYLTWDDSLFHFLWTGSDWTTDGDLFIYLDTLPGQGSLAAYNPYPSTAQSTLLLLPAGEDQANPAEGAMYADFALWVMDSERAHLLRWDGTSWIDDGPLEELGGAYAFNHAPEARYTDLALPFALIGNPGASSMGLIAFAVDGEEGPSQGLRLWSVLPYVNPVDSRRVAATGPAPDRPHRMALTDRYTVPLTAGTCFRPEANLAFSLSTNSDGFTYDPTDNATRLLLAELSATPGSWDALFAPYDDAYQAWLTEEYCPTDPAFPGCWAATKPPAALDARTRLAQFGLAESRHQPLLPGTAVAYTLDFHNPTAEQVTLPAYLYTNGDRANPQAGVTFAGQSWVDGCPGWLALNLPPGSGSFTISGLVGDAGVHSLTLEIDPTFGRNGCALTGDTGGSPAHRLTVEHTPDDGPPGHIAIAPDFTASGPVSATVRGVVRDISPVPSLEIEVTGDNLASSFTCGDDSPTDGQWACAWDIAAANGGSLPAEGARFTLRARATDIFGQQGAWSAPREVTIDTQSPQIELAASLTAFAQQDGVSAPLVSDTILPLAGSFSDSAPLRTVEVCLPGAEECELADLHPAPLSVPPSVYTYPDQLDVPLGMDGAITSGATCPAGSVGLIRTFQIGESFAIANLEVGLRLAHPYRSDLAAILTAPSGEQITLFDFDRNVLAQNVNALFSDLGIALLSDDLNSHDLAGNYARNTYRPEDDLSALAGQNGTGEWTLTLCDRDPNRDGGEFYDAVLRFTPVAPPLTFTGTWSYRADVGDGDGVLYARHLFATDEHGHRSSTPLAVQVLVDNVAPVLEATQLITSMLIYTSQPMLTGAVEDGGGVQDIWVAVTDPLGRVTTEAIAVAGSGWTYAMFPSLAGVYRLVVSAADEAGNQVSTETFAVVVLRPPQISQQVTPEQNVQAGSLITYTLQAVNPNLDAAAENVRLGISLSEWLTPVETAGATATEGALTWPPIRLAPGEAVSRTVLARLTDNLMITSTITGTLPITDWVNLNGVAIISQAFVETDNLGRQEAHPASFTIKDIHTQPESALEKEAFEGEYLAGEEPVTTPPTEEEVPVAEVEASAQLALTLKIHEGPITSMVSDSEFGLATGSEDGTIRFVQNEDGSGITINNGSGAVNSIAFSPDSSILASGLDNGSVEIWAWQDEEFLTVLEGVGGAINAVAWSSDGLLATGGDDGVILIWDALAGETLFALEGHDGAVNALSWIPPFIGEGAGYLVSAGDDGTVRLWNVESEQPVLTITDHEGPTNDVLWVGQVILSAGDDGTVRLWRLAGESWESVTAEPLAVIRHENAVNSVAIAEASGYVVSGSADGSLAVWNLSSEEIPTEPEFVLRGHVGSVNGVGFLNETIVSGGDDGTVRVWDLTITEP